jgi:cytochrome c oxidase subunit 2
MAQIKPETACDGGKPLGDGMMGFPALLAQSYGSIWFTQPGSTSAHGVDWLYYFVLAISVFFFALVVLIMAGILIKYRARHPEAAAQSKATHHLMLETFWTIVPLLLVMVIFYFGFVIFLDLEVRPQETYDIQVIGQKWKWQFVYPNGHIDDVLHVPIEKPTHLIMTSEDVLHDVFIPDFRIKMDVIPGRYTHLWFQPTVLGKHLLFCAEYCGKDHSQMNTEVVVHEPGKFDVWLREIEAAEDNLPPVQRGAKLYQSRGCAQCHTIDGKTSTCPTFFNLFGSTAQIKGAGSVVVDENYIRESVLEPQAKIVEGFAPVMPTYAGRLSDKDITGLIEYIKTLK